MSKSFFWWKSHNERINIRSFSTYRFGLSSHGRLIYSERHIFSKWQAHEQQCVWLRMRSLFEILGFEMCNRRGIERSTDLDYSRGEQIRFLIFFKGSGDFPGSGDRTSSIFLYNRACLGSLLGSFSILFEWSFTAGRPSVLGKGSAGLGSSSAWLAWLSSAPLGSTKDCIMIVARRLFLFLN